MTTITAPRSLERNLALPDTSRILARATYPILGVNVVARSRLRGTIYVEPLAFPTPLRTLNEFTLSLACTLADMPTAQRRIGVRSRWKTQNPSARTGLCKANLKTYRKGITMQIVNQEVYDSARAKNTEFYGKGILDYAERWADLMESKIADGQQLIDVAKATSYEADIDGITGFMYGAAVSFLAGTWAHGEALRKWSNADLNPDQADDPGVLNPALISFRKKN